MGWCIWTEPILIPRNSILYDFLERYILLKMVTYMESATVHEDSEL
jgi:hypothetical protein